MGNGDEYFEISLCTNPRACERMAKLGDPAPKIVQMKEKSNGDLLVKEATGLRNYEETGYVSYEV
jgi:hypothetical protein